MKWQDSQQHELQYAKNQESKIWQIPYSLKYWREFLHLDTRVRVWTSENSGLIFSSFDHSKQGIEVGCGNNGIYNFTSNIVGIDTINFHKSNFIQASAEHIPIKKVDYAILCNSLDHCSNPQQVLNQLSQITSEIILWTYIHPKIVSFLLSKYDKLHPHHFTTFSLSFLLKNFNVVYEKPYLPINFWKYTKSKKMKFKLLVMYLLNVQGKCIHLTKKEEQNCQTLQ